MRLPLERAMTPGADPRSRVKSNPFAMVAGWRNALSRRSDNRNSAVPSSFGSSQVRMALPSAKAVTRGVMLLTGTGVLSSRQPSAIIREPDLELQPARARMEGKAAEKPNADEASINCLRVIFILFILLPSP